MQVISDFDADTDQLTISKSIQKVREYLKDKHNKGEDISPGIEQLKGKILSKNAFASLVACQTFVKLYDDSIIDTNRVTALFLPILQSSNLVQFTSLVESLFKILLIDLRKTCANSGRYVCPYKILPPEQHPLLILFSKETMGIAERQYFLLDQINQALSYRENIIFENSLEYLKPVLFHIFSNCLYSDTVWRNLLCKSRGGDPFYQEIILFSRSNDPSTALYSMDIISKATKYFLKTRDNAELQSLTLCLIVSTIHLSEHGISVETPLKLINRLVCESMTDSSVTGTLVIMLLADLLQTISPYDAPILIKILQKLIVEQSLGTSLALHMVLDGLTQMLSCGVLNRDTIIEIEDIFNFVATKDNNKRFYEECGQAKLLSNYAFFNDRISAYYEFEVFFRGMNEISMTEVMKQVKLFYQTYPLIARGLFLSNQLRYDAWLEIFSQLINMNKKSKHMQNTWRMPFLYKISNEMHPKTKNLLLTSLPDFGKDAVTNTIACLAKTTGNAFAVNLYLRLWMVDERTYPMLHEALKDKTITGSNVEKYETQITKAYIIKRVCELKPSQHGSELVQLISELLNTPDNEVTIVLALESLAILCENSVVNIMSTWKAISFKYRYETRSRILKSLFVFFSKIPKLYQTSNEFVEFTREIIRKLWTKALYHVDNDVSVCGAAIDTLAMFPKHVLLLDDIPELLKKGIKNEEVKQNLVPGQDPIKSEYDGVAPAEIWINLMENTYRPCIENVAVIISNFISEEIREFRGGVFIIPEGRFEPKDVKSLPEKCVLRAIIQFLLQQSRQQTADDHIICGLLKALAQKFSKPLPPLEWNFLHEFFHNGLDIKHNCIRILANQLSVSKSAKQMMENYIRNFDLANFLEEDIGVLFEKIHELTDCIDGPIYVMFVKKSMMFSQSSDSSNILFEHILSSIPAALTNKGPELGTNAKALCEIIEETMISIDTPDENFHKFLKLTKCLPLKLLDKIVLNGLDSKNMASFKKALAIIRSACSQPSNADNPLNWLLQAFEQAQKKSNLQHITLETSLAILSNYTMTSKAFHFIMELLTKIQNIFGKSAMPTGSTRASDSAKTVKTVINKSEASVGIVLLDNSFLIEALVTSIIALSGNAFMLRGSMENETDRTLKRCFPHSLYNLLKQEIWAENQGRVLEAIYKIYQTKDVPEIYADMFKNAIVCSKNLPYFDQHQIWYRFVVISR